MVVTWKTFFNELDSTSDLFGAIERLECLEMVGQYIRVPRCKVPQEQEVYLPIPPASRGRDKVQKLDFWAPCEVRNSQTSVRTS